MKITVRLIISLLFAAASAAAVFSYIQVQNEKDMMVRELDARADVLAKGLEGPVQFYLHRNDLAELQHLVDRFRSGAPLMGIAVFDSMGEELATSTGLRALLPSTPSIVGEAVVQGSALSSLDEVGGHPAELFAFPMLRANEDQGTILLCHDASFIDQRVRDIWYNNFFRLLAQFVLIVVTTIVVVRWSITGPIAQAAKWLRGLRMEKGSQFPGPPRGDILGPIALEVSLLAKSLAQARAAAQQEARLRVEGESLWTAERLKEHVRVELREQNLFVVSNREPYMHVSTGGSVECIVPPGGLVTALDPILRACGGVWIAHGNGSADRETADAEGRLRVPPDEPFYTLHRVYLTKEEEEGYYFGFSNEGIWPLCHITHTRPLFRPEDWEDYQVVNKKFADTLLEDIRHEESPLVLIQDYHFSLLPMLVKSQRPDARVAIFWHIPWPNPEVFGICPWKEELLIGLLGADLIGFHTQFHCNNFLGTVDRFLESKTNWDQFSIERNKLSTMVRPFPISVALPDASGEENRSVSPEQDRMALLRSHGIAAPWMGVGVDRIDYTKGILERFLAVERFLSHHPEYVGKFTFVELGAPSRTHIKRYHDLIAELDEAAERINWSFQTKTWKPIVFLKAHHTHETISRYYRAANLCLVTSLHDGMNLVAKEFVASRVDGNGVLILSQFAGAASELQDALIVNPYDTEAVAQAIYTAVTMPAEEQQVRMASLQRVVRERNVYRWAASIITALSRIRLPKNIAPTVP